MAAPVPSSPLDQLVAGYPKLAGKMELVPEMAIFRKFGALNARNLLYLQSELAFLEKQLIEQENLDNVIPEKIRYALDWYWLSESQSQGNPKQLNLILKIRETIKEYNNALLQQANVQGLEEPDEWDLRELQHFLETREMGPLALIGDDATIWGSVEHPKSYSNDLVTLHPRRKDDPFSRWFSAITIKTLFRYGCARWKKRSRVHGAASYQDDSLFKITLWITTILASMIPVASIVVLYYVESIGGRLGVLALFNLIITASLATFTNAKRVEIFAVSAGFTAVQAVFINTSNK